MPTREADLLVRYRRIHAERMAGLPICNPRLGVDTVGFRDFNEQRVGVLITPWFMNLVVLPGDGRWDGAANGGREELSLPSGPFEFTISREDGLGSILTAVLFRTMSDFPDQRVAVAVARHVLQQLFTAPGATPRNIPGAERLSRRQLLTGVRAS